jgi:hypothetical protein
MAKNWQKYLNSKGLLNEAGFLDELGNVAGDIETIKNSIPGKIIGGAIEKHQEKSTEKAKEKALGTAKSHLDDAEMILSGNKPDSKEFKDALHSVFTARNEADKKKKTDVVEIYDEVIDKNLDKKADFYIKMHTDAMKGKKIQERNKASATLKAMIKNLDQDNRTRTKIIDYFGNAKKEAERASEQEAAKKKQETEKKKQSGASKPVGAGAPKPKSPATGNKPKPPVTGTKPKPKPKPTSSNV